VKSKPADLSLINNPSALRQQVIRALSLRCGIESLFRNPECDANVRISSVLLLLGEQVPEDGNAPETCIILNKRSQEVRQPGDLCCPGGGIESNIDPFFGRLLTLPGSTLSKWPCWHELKKDDPESARFLCLLLAAGLRESWEEMRLNPFGASFLGPLPSQCLVLYRRVIHPLVAWVRRQKKFTLSWEVDRLVHIPFRALLNPFNYATYRLNVPAHMEWRFRARTVDFPCFLYSHSGRAELLWGATYRIVTLLLETVFGFFPPVHDSLPLVPASLSKNYVNGGPAKNRHVDSKIT
jgi:hypothetical protein